MSGLQTRRAFLRSATLLAGSAVFGCGLRERTGQAVAAAARFLASLQSPDGAWRSAQSGALRDGDALTPLVLWALAGRRGASGESVARGRRWLEQLTDAQAAAERPWEGLHYPLFTAGYAAQFFAGEGDGRRAAFWAGVAGQLRIGPALGWAAGEEACGAWSDASVPPMRPPGEGPLPDMLAPNVSATQLGLRALAAGGRARDEGALPFLASCQNFAPEAGSALDDGGFFFAIDDPVRNKAGVAGSEAPGRFRSYGSATCDGVLAMVDCGLTSCDPRMRAALGWLERHADGARHPGDWPPDRADDGESLRFYHAQAFSAVLALAGPFASRWARAQCRALVGGLVGLQESDGSWRGRSPNSFEDDPLVATAFGLRALGNARRG